MSSGGLAFLIVGAISFIIGGYGLLPENVEKFVKNRNKLGGSVANKKSIKKAVPYWRAIFITMFLIGIILLATAVFVPES